MNRKMQFLVRHPESDEEVREAVKCWKKVGTGGTFYVIDGIRELPKEYYQEVFIAVDPENQLVGAVSILRNRGLWIGGVGLCLLKSHEVHNIAVYPQYQRQGIGRALVLAVEESEKQEGRAGSLVSYSEAEEFWKALGYRKVAPAFWYKIF